MAMKMNNDFIDKLIEKTNKSKEECIIISKVLQEHFIVGRNNKEKIKRDFMEKLSITSDQADEIYNICAELWLKNIFK